MFFEFGIKDFIDILLVAFLLYYTYKLMKASGSINVFTGILVFILIWLVVSQVLEMKLLGSIFDKLVSVGVLALIILFQDEIRRFLDITPQEALNGTTVLDTICLLKGADILRVHDVKEAVETVRIVQAMRNNS